jgi:hypothetical protein
MALDTTLSRWRIIPQLFHPLTCSCEVDVVGDEGEKSAVEK